MNVEQVSDRDSFVAYLGAMRSQLQSGGESWENIKLDDFLEAMAAWAHDWQEPCDLNPWKHAANLLRAGAFYE